MLKELGISFGTALGILISLYFVIKWAVKNGIRDYYAEKEKTEELEDENNNNEESK